MTARPCGSPPRASRSCTWTRRTRPPSRPRRRRRSPRWSATGSPRSRRSRRCRPVTGRGWSIRACCRCSCSRRRRRRRTVTTEHVMPWHVAESSQCPASRPWAVIKDDDGEVEGCHATEAEANKQLAALNASEGEESKMTTVTEVDPRQVLRSQVHAHFFEFRAAEPATDAPTDGRTLEGHAAVFDQPTTIDSFAGSFEEVVKRGAFRKTLAERQPVMQFDHGNDKRTGSTPIGSIQDIHEDDQGLFVRARLFDNDLVEPI